MAKGLTASGARRNFQLTLDNELATQIATYHSSMNLGGSVQDSIRELLKLALSSVPEESLIYSARMQGFNRGLDEIKRDFATFLHDLQLRYTTTMGD